MSAPASKSGSNVEKGHGGQSGTQVNRALEVCAEECAEQREDFQMLLDDVGGALNTYWKRRPGVAACMLFGIGFYVGWRMKPW